MIHPGSTHYIDLHTHARVSGSGVFCLPSHFIQDLELRHEMNAPFSAGLHPWHLNDTDVSEQIKNLHMLAGNDLLKAIGECGLDRNVSVNFELQRDAFIQQMKLANQHQKPLIIHAVKSYSDFLNLVKVYGVKTTWIFHGFNGNSVIARKLLKQEDVYLSFGAGILRPDSIAARVLENLPANRIFLETDESDSRIEEIYDHAAELLKLDTMQLKKQLYNNYMEVFDG